MAKNKNKKRNRIIMLVVIAIIVILVIVSVLTSNNKKDVNNDLGINDVTVVDEENLMDTISAKGVVQSKDIETVLANSNLKVLKVNVEVGDKVNKGDVLAVLDSSDLEKSLDTTLQSNNVSNQTANLNYEDSVQALRDTIKTGEETNETLWDQWVATADISPVEHESLGVQLATNNDIRFTAQDTLDQVEGRLPVTSSEAKRIILLKQSNNTTASSLANSADSIKTQIEAATLVATTSGTITTSNLQVGDYANSVAFIIQNLDELEVVSSINERDFSSITEGLKADISSDAISNVNYDGTVSLIAPVATTVGTNTIFTTTIDIDNEDGQIRPGMNAKVKYILFEEKAVLSVPIDSVVKEDDKSYVYVLSKDGEEYTATKTEVTTGQENDINVTIISGVKANDLVMNYPTNYEEVETIKFIYTGSTDGE